MVYLLPELGIGILSIPAFICQGVEVFRMVMQGDYLFSDLGLGTKTIMVGDTGLEPVTSAMSTQCSNHLS